MWWSANSEATVSANSVMRGSRSVLRRASIISIDHAFFHDEEHLFGLADIFRRVAGDGHDVGEFPGVQRTNLVLQAEKFGVGQGRGTQCIDGLHAEINHQVKFFGIAAMLIDGSVGAETDFYAFSQSVLKHL